MINIIYIHGMGGGSDSRIPSILSMALSSHGITVNVRTYDFDPEKAEVQIKSWVEELNPSLVIGESLGSLHTLRVTEVPRIFISPALNASFYFELMAWLTLIPGFTILFDRIYKPREGDRQKLHFTFRTLRKFRPYRKKSMEIALSSGRKCSSFAFIGTCDHYRKTGVVSLKTWKKYFGQSFRLYEGTHFMEEEYVYSLLVPEILKLLDIK